MTINAETKQELILASFRAEVSIAENAQAQFLVTGDKALHSLGSFGSTRLIDPAAFAD